MTHISIGPDGLRCGLTPPPVPGAPATLAALVEGLRGPQEQLVDRRGSLSRDAVREGAAAYARALSAAGLRPGERLAASAPGSCDLVLAFLGCQQIGAVWVGLNPSLTAAEMRGILHDCGAVMLLASPAVAEKLGAPKGALREVLTFGDDISARLSRSAGQPLPQTAATPLSPAAIAYTSGTTGRPKGAVHSHHSILSFVFGSISSGLGGHWRGDLRRGITIPLTILNGMSFGPLVAIAGGGVCAVMDRIDSEGVAEQISRDRIEMLGSTPTTILDLMTRSELQRYDISSLKFAFTGGAAGSPALRDAFRTRAGSELCEVYGMTESPCGVTGSTATRPPLPGGVGRALPHIELRALSPEGAVLAPGEVGELCLRPVGTGAWAGVYAGFLGYWNLPEETAKTFQGGWLHTGDMGMLDAQGEVSIVGRHKDMILRGGANVYPAEVERLLMTHPDVLEAVVAGLPDERLGEVVGAWLRLRAGADSAAVVGDLARHAARDLSRYKVPAHWFAAEDFPRNAMNKVQKDRLIALDLAEIRPLL